MARERPARPAPRSRNAPPPTVLVVDDDPGFRSMLWTLLDADYDVRFATSGREALDRIDEAIDVVLLDRRLGAIDGETVLETIRDRGFETPVIMVTGVEPDVDIIDLPFDAYVAKPVSREALVATIRAVRKRAALDETVRPLFALASNRAALEAAMDPDRLQSSEEFSALKTRYEATAARLEIGLARALEEDDPAMVSKMVLD